VTILRRIFAKPGQFALGAAVCGLLALPAPSIAAPLDKDSCAKLTQDMQNMKMLEVDKLMEKGPSWAASHLTSADLSLVRQYIDLDEQLKFRCSAPGSLVHLKHLDDEEEEAARPSWLAPLTARRRRTRRATARKKRRPRRQQSQSLKSKRPRRLP